MSKKDRSAYPSQVSEPVVEVGEPIVEVSDPMLNRPAPAVIGPDLETAAEVVLQHTPTHIQEMLRDVLSNSTRPLSAFLLAYIQRAYEQRVLARPLGEEQSPVARPAAPPASRECAWCQKPFQPAHTSQLYCQPTDDTEPCSVQAGMAELRKARGARTTPRGVEVPPRVARRESHLI